MSPLPPQGSDAGMAIEVVFFVLASVMNQEVFLLCDELQDVPCAVFEIRSELDGQCGTRFLTQTAVNAPCKVDPEPGSPTPAVFTFCRFHGDAAHRTHGRAEVAGDTALFSVRVTSKDNSGPGPLRKRSLVLRVFFGDLAAKKMGQGRGHSADQCPDALHKLLNTTRRLSNHESPISGSFVTV